MLVSWHGNYIVLILDANKWIKNLYFELSNQKSTDDEESVSYLNNWDKKIQNLDVVDDFRNERREILRVKGTRFRY